MSLHFMLLQVRHTVPMANSWMICRRIERLFDRLKRIRCVINLVLGSFPGPSHLSASKTTCKLRDSNCLRVQLLSNVVSKRWQALVNNCVLQGLELRFYFRFCEPQGLLLRFTTQPTFCIPPLHFGLSLLELLSITASFFLTTRSRD